jgi:hypothetical protein
MICYIHQLSQISLTLIQFRDFHVCRVFLVIQDG